MTDARGLAVLQSLNVQRPRSASPARDRADNKDAKPQQLQGDSFEFRVRMVSGAAKAKVPADVKEGAKHVLKKNLPEETHLQLLYMLPDEVNSQHIHPFVCN